MNERRQPAFGDDWQRSSSGLWLPTTLPRRRYQRPVAIDLFCGCGGFSLGVIQAGFQVVAAVDNEAAAAFTYMLNLGAYPCEFHYGREGDKERLNATMERHARRKKGILSAPLSGSGWRSGHPDVPGVDHFFFGDIRRFTGEQILQAVGLEVGDVDMVFGSPPCQGFSRAGRRNVMDPRNGLVFEFARLVLEIRPKTLAMENVPDLLSMVTPEGISVIDAFCHVLSDGGFAGFDALRRSLVGMKDARVAMRATDKPQSSDTATLEAAEPVEQMALF